jgi:hypothetical protein
VTPSERLQFIGSLLGKPWREGAKGPDEYSCWGLNQLVQKTMFGRELPDIPEHPMDARELMRFAIDHPARSQWLRVPSPHDGCLVEMAHVTHPYHMGTFLAEDGGCVLHCAPKTGVTIDSLLTLKAAGWRKIVFDAWAA